jgi:hypothetical protein
VAGLSSSPCAVTNPVYNAPHEISCSSTFGAGCLFTLAAVCRSRPGRYPGRCAARRAW